MSWRQPDLFCGEKQPAKTLRPDRAYRPAPRSAPKPFAWESMGAWVRLMHRLFAIEQPSSDHYRRSRETARELTVTRVRACRHDDDLERIEQMLIEARAGSTDSIVPSRKRSGESCWWRSGTGAGCWRWVAACPRPRGRAWTLPGCPTPRSPG